MEKDRHSQREQSPDFRTIRELLEQRTELIEIKGVVSIICSLETRGWKMTLYSVTNPKP